MADRPIYLASRFPRTWKTLSARQKEQVIEIILELPNLLKNPHHHSGFGFRRLQGGQWYEARLDLRWRLILLIKETEIILFDVMNHDQVKRL
jgi:mRNA-degrading endonuclease RelE of RelBE toxin-antitoxin system